MIIIIDTNTWLIKIEKGEEIKTAPKVQLPIHYNEINIKRKYLKKTDKGYHRRPNWQSIVREQLGIKTTSRTSQLNKIVRQEPLLDFH